jgi:hypothetical protein
MQKLRFPATYQHDYDEQRMADAIMEEYKDDPVLRELLAEFDNCASYIKEDKTGMSELRESISKTR